MATITFDQATLSPPGILDRSRTDGLIDGSEVTITVDEPGIVTFVDVPEGDLGSVSSLAETAPQTWKFSPTAGVYGSWLVQFQPAAANASPVRRVFAVRSPKKALRVPAFNERASIEATVANGASFVDASDDNEGENYRGWAKSLTELYHTVSDISVPLTSNVTVYVDSVAGLDSNPGTQAAPFQTFMRAWQERQRYGALRARFTIQLIGAGPYTFTQHLDGSVCESPSGYLVIAGDTTAETTHYTGTFTGDFSGLAINTSSGLGADTHKMRWVRVTSGVCTGAEFQILEHTDSQIIAVSKQFRTSIGAITAGTTFTIFTPGTIVNPSTFAILNWSGGHLTGYTQDPRHIIHHVQFSNAVACREGTVIGLIACKITAGGLLIISGANVATRLLEAGISLGAPHASIYKSAGSTVSNYSAFYHTVLVGPLCSEGALVASSLSHTEVQGGRISGLITVSQFGQLLVIGNDIGARFDAANRVTHQGMFKVGGSSSTYGRWAVTTGDCIQSHRGGIVVLDAFSYNGGTTDPAGFAVNTANGGRAYLINNSAGSLTGGTTGKDLKTTANPAGVPMSAISTIPSAVDALGSPYGEVLARISPSPALLEIPEV